MDETGNYGQFGRAIYDRDEKAWHFQRSTETSRTFELLGESKRVINASYPPDRANFPAEGKEGPSRRRQIQAKGVVRGYADTQPASISLSDLARISEAVETSPAQHDPLKGDLLAFGTISDEFAKRQAQVVAFASGPAGSNLRIVQVQGQHRGWHTTWSTYLRVPTIYGEEAVWKGPGVPIQSIAFANPLEGAENFLAVRLPTEIIVFRPVLRKKLVHGGSRLDVNRLVNLNMAQASCEPFTAVAFNPWYSRQIAFLDLAGHCMVFELEGKAFNGMKKLVSSQLPNDQKKHGKASSQDCWGQISWIHGPSMLAVVTKRNLNILNVVQEDLVELHELNVGSILNMTTIPAHPSHLAVVTSQHIIIYRVDVISVRVIVHLRHFRSADDISLRASCFANGNDSLLVVRSCLDSSVFIYHLHLTRENETKIFDPAELRIPCPQRKHPGRISSLHVTAVDIKGELSDGPPKFRSNENSAPVCFLQFTTLYSDLSGLQTLYTLSRMSNSPPKLGPISWQQELSKSIHKVLDDDFIAGDNDTGETGRATIPSEPTSKFVRRISEPQSHDTRDWTVNYELSARYLDDVDVADVTGIDEVIETFQGGIKNLTSIDAIPFRSLTDFVDSEVTIRDIDHASAELEKLFLSNAASRTENSAGKAADASQTNPRLTLQSIKSLPILRLCRSASVDHLRLVHQSLSDAWVLRASDVSDIVKHSKDETARRMAAEAVLARVIIRPREPDPLPLFERQSQPDNVWELGVRAGATASTHSTPSVNFDAASQPQSSRSPQLPTPSETGSSASAGASTGASNAILERLSRYTTLTSSLPTPPRRVNRILTHWSVGADPASYDWTTTSRHVSRREEEETQDEEMTEKEGKRERRRTERYVRRQQREVEETARMQLLTSQARPIITSSQPASSQQAAASVRDVQSQSQSQSQGTMMASQVLPGRHGGRPAKKKRKQGF